MCYLRDCIFICSDSQQKSNGCESGYLLHPVVNSFLDMYEVRSRLSEALLKFHIGGVGKEILYMICIIFIVVSICLAISCVLRGCKMAMVRVMSGKADK